MLNLQMLLKNTLLPWSISDEISVGAALLMEDVPSKVQTLLQKVSRWVAMLVQKSLSQPAFRKMISYRARLCFLLLAVATGPAILQIIVLKMKKLFSNLCLIVLSDNVHVLS